MDLHQLVCDNQTIKIVPSIEDSLKTLGLNVDLDQHSKAWFEQLKVTWKTWKKSPAVENHIETFFHSTTEPYRVALIFVINCVDYKDCKPKSLPYLIVEILHKWSQFNGQLPENYLKLPAFHIAIHQRNQNFLALIVKTYQLMTAKEKILPIVKDMIKSDNCKQASQIIIAMQLFDDIPVEDLLFPLVLQDKSNLIDDYLTECPSQVKPLLLYLDKLLDKSVSIREFVQNYIEEKNISHIKYEKVHHKPLGKLVARLCNKFNIPIETCKNLSKNRTVGGLRYLIHQKYQEHNVSSSVWEDLVKDSLKQNAGSAQEFIDMLVEYDKNEALKWASYLNMSDDLLPLALKEISLNDIPEQEDWERDVSASQKFYKFSLPEDVIMIVDTCEKFGPMLSDVEKTSIASIDCEWKPSFGASHSQVALIQIATIDRVFLIDTLVLNKPEYSSLWSTFNKKFLDNAEIIKVGFGLEQDLKEIKSSMVGLGNIKVQGEGLLDLGTLWRSLLNNGLVLPANSDNAGNSLSSVVQSCFGLPLEKSEQCSNWELRPLRNTQIMYAALDAHVLVQIYDFLQKLCMQQLINFEEICNDVMTESKKKCTKKPKVIDRFLPPVQSYSAVNPRSAKDTKFLIEHTLSDLMSYLRYCGIDTSVFPPQLLWHDVINIAISEDRFILLSKMKFTPNTNYPQSSILEIHKDTLYQQISNVLSSFKVDVKQEDLFKFCVNCNSKYLTRLSTDDFEKICNEYKVALATVVDNPVRYHECEYDEELGYNDHFCDSDCEEDIYRPGLYYNQTIKTSMGAPIEICNFSNISSTNKSAILCEECGRLFWDQDPLLKPIIETVYSWINLKWIW